MKTIDTLVPDIYEVLKTRGGWDAAITDFMSEGMRELFFHRLEDDEQERDGTLRMSNIGKPCKRQLYYEAHDPDGREEFAPSTLLKFIYGDMIELLVLSLAQAAGHDVRGMQDELEISDIKGHRDAVIDGVTVDVKSASPYSFTKFKEGTLEDDDPFGYLTQLSSYVYAGHKEDSTINPVLGAFLAINKVSGELHLDVHQFTFESGQKEEEYETVKELMVQEEPPHRGFEPVEDGYTNKKREFVPNGNLKLGLNCSYCSHKHSCYDNIRTFMYKRGNSYQPVYLVHVEKEPKVLEVTNDE